MLPNSRFTKREDVNEDHGTGHRGCQNVRSSDLPFQDLISSFYSDSECEPQAARYCSPV